MSSKSQTSLLLATLAGTVLGGLLGYYLPELMLSFSFIGQLFLNALRIIVIPFVVASVIVGIAALANIDRVNRAIGKSLLYFGVTSLIAVLIGYALVAIIRPGVGIDTAGALAPAELTRVTSFSINQILSSILPESLLSATAQGNLLGLVIFALFIGATVIILEGKGKAVVDFFAGLHEVLTRIIQYLLWVAPVGLLFLVATAVAQNAYSGSRLVSSVGLFSLTVLAAFIIQGLVILPLALTVLAKRPFWSYLSSTAPALFTAFGTGSPTAALPVTMDCAIGRGNVDNRACAVTLPLGAMINMNGTALYLVIGAFFCAQAFQVDLSILQTVGIVAVAFLLSVAASLVPHGSLLILGVLLFSVGLPIEAYAAIGLILIVDWFFERLRATLNVWGDAVGAAVIAETFEFKTARHVTSSDSSRRQKPLKRGDITHRRDQRPPSSEKRRPDQQDRQPTRDSRSRGPRRDDKRRDGGRPDHRGRGQRFEDKKPDAPGRVNRPEKRPNFEMPTPPYHVLQGELKSRKAVPPVEAEPTGALSPETIERERVKIAAQLAEMGQKQEPVREKIETEMPSEEPKGQPFEQTSAYDDSGSDYPRVDFVSDDNSFPPDRSPAAAGSDALGEEGGEADDEPGDESSSSLASTTFGRKKARRGAAMKNMVSTEDKQEPEEKEESKPEFSTENISFGRSKRKKPGA